MISIRENVFESNSSSCHSLTFPTKGSAKVFPGTSLIWEGDEFGWQQEKYHDPQSKFSYWLVAFTTWIEGYQGQVEREIRKNQEYWLTDRQEYWDDHNGPASLKSFQKAADLFQQTVFEVIKLFKARKVAFKFYDRNNKPITEDEFVQDVHNRSDKNSFKTGYTVLDVDYGGYIDHQSGPLEDPACKKLAMMKPEEVFEWVFGDSYIETDNDNH